MRHNPLPLLSLALVSALLASGPAYAAPNEASRPAADASRAGKPAPMFGNGPRAVMPDAARHHMQPGPHHERMVPGQRPGWHNDRRVIPPRWNDERPVPPMPPRRHYQPAPGERNLRPMPPALPGDDTGRWGRPYRDERPAWPNNDDIPFRYR